MSRPIQPAPSVEERLADLEHQFEELRRQVLGARPGSREKDWRRTAGTFARDEMTVEVERLGAEWRKQQTAP